MATRVVHVRSRTWKKTPPGGRVYVGRPFKEFRGDGWGNPFRQVTGLSRSDVIERYRAHVVGQPRVVEAIRQELRGRVLGCWCAPLDRELTADDTPWVCHGQVLADIADGATQ